MSNTPSPWCRDEPGYVAQLSQERSLYAWCLTKYGAVPPDEAMNEAAAFYTYEPADHPYRGLIFHAEAWHYAMVKLFGARYWLTHSDYQSASPEYGVEARRLAGG